MLLTMLGDGRLHLTAIAKLAPHLTRENRDALLKRAVHKTKQQIEELIAEIAPRPDVPAMVRKLPERGTPPTAGHLVASSRGSGPTIEFGPRPTIERLGPNGVVVPDGENGPTRGLRPGGVAAPELLRGSPFVVQLLSPRRY